MKPIDTSEDLATIVSQGASKPVRKWLIISILVGLLAGGIVYYLKDLQKAPDETEYLTGNSKMGEISLIVTASGNLAPTNQVIIGSELSGTVDEVYVETNDLVKKDQPLAKLDTTKLSQQTDHNRATLLSAKAKVSQTEATVAETKAALARQEELLKLSDGKTPSRATMETSRAAVAIAVANLESARADVAGAEADVISSERDLRISIIRAPVDGVVLSRSIEVGQTVAASFTAPTLFTVAENLKKMDLLVNVSEADIGRVKVGQTATFTVDAWPARKYTAKVKKVEYGAVGTGVPVAPGASATGVVTYSTELDVSNEDLSLRPGMTATVDIAIEDKKDILIVPNAALRFDPEVAAKVGKPDDTSRTLVQSLSSRGGRRWRGAGPRKQGDIDAEPRVWYLENGKPTGMVLKIGITDGRYTEVTSSNLKADMPLITGINPPKSE
jgi:HlyD family secretion protein